MHFFEGPDLGHSTIYMTEVEKKKNQRPAGFKPSTSRSWGECSTAVQQPRAQTLECYLGNSGSLTMARALRTVEIKEYAWKYNDVNS